MSDTASTPGGDHPDHDLLSDYAAQVVLTPEMAARVAAHVLDCADCAGLLAEAEGVRTALRALPPEPVPADVMSRLEEALASAATTPEAEDDAAPAPARPDRVLRPTVTALPEGRRRQARAESRTGRWSPARYLPPPRWVAAAAAVLVLGVAAVGVVGALQDDQPTTAASSDAGGTAAGAPVLAPVLRTNTDYRPDRLKSQVSGLVKDSEQASGALAARGGTPTDSYEFNSGSAPKGASSGAERTGPQSLDGSVDRLPGPLGAASSAQLASPGALRACLAAIGEPDRQPAAVDLARYRGQDAAVIVIDSEDGGYDVWVVARDCRPGADGTIDFVHIAS